eukprot:gene7365-8147_t
MKKGGKAQEVKEPEPEPVPEVVKGSGQFLLPDNSVYEGEYEESNGVKVRHGHGKMTVGPESYDGQWEKDSMHGEGEYVFASGARYKGHFHQGFFHNYGEYTFPDGAVYLGQWNQNRMHGEGTYVNKDKQEFPGQFVNGYYNTGKSYISIRNHGR